ncbi:retrotransposon protein, putative, ty1-copia subclass [Tanacetum coccineum]
MNMAMAKRPNLSYLKVWGLRAYVKRDSADKLQQRLTNVHPIVVSNMEVEDDVVRNLGELLTIRILIAIAAYYDYEIWQMDVKTAFLNGRLDEDIYMEQPEGLKEVKDFLGKCKEEIQIKNLRLQVSVMVLECDKDVTSIRRVGYVLCQWRAVDGKSKKADKPLNA